MYQNRGSQEERLTCLDYREVQQVEALVTIGVACIKPVSGAQVGLFRVATSHEPPSHSMHTEADWVVLRICVDGLPQPSEMAL